MLNSAGALGYKTFSRIKFLSHTARNAHGFCSACRNYICTITCMGHRAFFCLKCIILTNNLYRCDPTIAIQPPIRYSDLDRNENDFSVFTFDTQHCTNVNTKRQMFFCWFSAVKLRLEMAIH